LASYETKTSDATVSPLHEFPIVFRLAQVQNYNNIFNQPEKRYLTYPIEMFRFLRKWITCLDNPEENPEFMLLYAEQIHQN
jgi:hypothetical protein